MATIELKLPIALEQGHLCAHYQPIVAARDRTVAGFEALVRWHDNELGEVTPEEFIPIAEDMGIVRRLGQMVIDQACGFTASLTDPEMSVTVNVSGSQLMDEAFPIFVAETLQKYDLTGDRLFFEITESVAMEAESSIWQVFEELTSVGVRLIVDDFGTGFSNLARLKELPFVAIKIDREFIRDLPNSPQDSAIFRAMHAIAKELNLKIVAEGIENADQEEFVCRFGVDYLQGFRFGHPVPVNKLRRYT
jgi:EAL domain-containing protein (putative c-di-GMP-specific phosphodiesterase class I)